MVLGTAMTNWPSSSDTGANPANHVCHVPSETCDLRASAQFVHRRSRSLTCFVPSPAPGPIHNGIHMCGQPTPAQPCHGAEGPGEVTEQGGWVVVAGRFAHRSTA